MALSRQMIFFILNSNLTNKEIANKFRVPIKNIINIRKGKTYSKYYNEFLELGKDLNKDFIKQNTLKIKSDTMYFYTNHYAGTFRTERLMVSFDDFLITFDLEHNRIDIDFNIRIDGESISYKYFKEQLLKSKFLSK